MTDTVDKRDELRRDPDFLKTLAEPGVRNYVFLGVAALIFYYAQMVKVGGDLGTLLTIIFAVPGLIFRWLISPMLFLIMLTYLLCDPNLQSLRDSLANEPYRLQPRNYTRDWSDDFMLALSIVIYFIAQYRVLSFVHQSMPDDPPPRRKGQPAPRTPRRPHRLFHERELAYALVSGIAFSLFGVVAWKVLDDYSASAHLASSWRITWSFTRFMLFFWVIGSLAMLAAAVFRYLTLLRMSKLEAQLILQDQLWQETRREQERIYRWRNWAIKVRRAKIMKRGKKGE